MIFCKLCNQTKSEDEFYKTGGKCLVFCKECRKVIGKRRDSKEWKAENFQTPEKFCCIKCNTVKTIDNFCKSKRHTIGFNHKCRECERERSRLQERKRVRKFYENPNIPKTHFCKKCNTEKPSEEFLKSKSCAIGIRNICRLCCCKQKQISVNNTYGLSEDMYQQDLEKCGSKCMICSRECKLVVDHNHSTGKYRGLLCPQCNSGIGMMKDNPDIANMAAIYLQKDLNKNIKIDYSSEELYAMSNV